jgi:hypothetical protein
VRVDPIKSTLKARGIKRLKLKFDKLRSNFAFKFNLRRYAVVAADYAFVIHTTNPSSGDQGELYAEVVRGLGEVLVGRGLHSLTSELNLSIFGIHRSRQSST